MPFVVSIAEAQAKFPEYTFVKPLTPSEQKAAFHVKSQDGRDLCLKIIAPNYSFDRLEREITALQAIEHPNVVRLVEYTFSSKIGDQRHYLVEEFIEGNDLTTYIADGHTWTREQVADFFAPLFDGLGELQRHGFVHRDLKPSNIRVNGNGIATIIDFGLARHLNLADLTQTAEGAAIGTPKFFAPEQFSGTKYDIDHRTDLFAAGILMHQALLGRHPFVTKQCSYDALAKAVCTNDDFRKAQTFEALPDEWKLLLGRLLEKDRARRPQGGNQVATILRRIRGV